MFNFIKNLRQVVPIYSFSSFKNELSIVIERKNLLASLTCLKLHIGYQYSLLTSIAGVDLLGKTYRFCVVYDLLSLNKNSRIRIKTFVNEISPVPSSVSLFVNANWWEREVWDLFGIYFEKHPDLRRILTDYGFEGFPLRKDFPLYGFVEVRYNESEKQIVAEPVQLSQEFRSFNFQTPW
jgi:NADH dehydrogenase (ubiquinone) Fe-S protein 3